MILHIEDTDVWVRGMGWWDSQDRDYENFCVSFLSLWTFHICNEETLKALNQEADA